MPGKRIMAPILAALLAGPVLAEAEPEPISLKLDVTEVAEAVPDRLSVSAGVVTMAAEAGTALADNSRQMNNVITALKRTGINSRDIRTSRLELQPRYRYAEGQARELVGFEARNQLHIILSDVSRSGAVIDTLVRAGANQVDGPEFTLAQPDRLLDATRAKAVQTAQKRARVYAEAAGLKLVGIRRMTESPGRITPMPQVARSMAVAADAPTPIEAGTVQLSVTLSMEYELVPAQE